MNFDTYATLAARSKSSQFNVDDVEDWKTITILKEILRHGATVDDLKKKLFYGRDSERLSGANLRRDPGVSLYASVNYPETDLVHAILGIYTEAVELVELLYQAMTAEGEIGKGELHFETGDLLWYISLLGLDIDRVMEDNIDKLKKRYPEKFDADRAINRDQYSMQI